MYNRAAVKRRNEMRKIKNSDVFVRAENALVILSESNLCPFATEKKREFLTGFTGSFEYCYKCFRQSKDKWERIEYLGVIKSNITELESIESWLQKLKKEGHI